MFDIFSPYMSTLKKIIMLKAILDNRLRPSSQQDKENDAAKEPEKKKKELEFCRSKYKLTLMP